MGGHRGWQGDGSALVPEGVGVILRLESASVTVFPCTVSSHRNEGVDVS